jgi:hypothetical protein
MRQQVLDVGKPAVDYLTELVHRRPADWIRDVERLHQLLQSQGPAALRAAFITALREQTIGAEYVAHYLGDALATATQKELAL